MKLDLISLPSDLRSAAEEMLSSMEIPVSSDGVSVSVSSCAAGFSVTKTDAGLSVSYARKCDFFRALTFASRVLETGAPVVQSASFSTLCYMADFSRNAVASMDGARRMIRYLARLGYDSMMLYTEDTYEIPDYPYFGHMRGRYSVAELKALDDYADSFGIELIPCIQTLAHLSSALRWQAFDPVRDTSDILLVGDDRTYALIDSMIKTLSSCFRSRRIHLGMDEAHNLGLGTYLDRNGYKNRFEILSGHLARVKQICDRYQLQPMIWSDMYFRLYNHGGYYMRDGKIPPEITSLLPDGVMLVYWDYYYDDRQLLDCMFENHNAFGQPIAFAGGAWKWSGFAPMNRFSYQVSQVQLDACIRNHCSDVIVTAWGDNGGEASQFSVLPCVALYAERCYSPEITDGELKTRFAECFSFDRDDYMKLDLPNDVFGDSLAEHKNPCKYLLYNGVFNGLMDAHVPQGAADRYLKNAQELLKFADHPEFGYLFSTLASLCFVLEKKCNLSVGIHDAYSAGKKDVLRWYADREIPEIISRLDDFLVLFRQQWYHENKTFGFDIQEIRIGGLKETLRSAAIRLRSYCNGEVSSIEELEQPVLPFRADSHGNALSKLEINNWEQNATASKFGS